ncbi:MAG: hypothetical protein A2020_11210 [Lentisphaerae bacterium GWF2_45_14]|nr:MAG: hypothetical protein A2020_11210 [Lentisphaerae bacterium GWF2_45_14]
MSKESFLDRLIDKLDSMDSNNIQAYILRLSREKGFLRTVFDAIHEGIIVIDRTLRIRYHNEAAKKLIGLPDDTSKLRISQLLRDIDWRKMLKEDVEEWYRISLKEVEVFYPAHRFIQFYIVPHENEHGSAAVILRDVTDLRQRTMSEIESEKLRAISLLAAGVAHEIGNPLNSIYLHLQLLQRQLSGKSELDREEAANLVKVSKEEVERLDTIINQFLAAVRPSKPSIAPLDIKEVIIESLNFMRYEIENRKVEVKCTWPELIPQIPGDEAQLKQAFYNILKNSLQAMPEGGKIVISCIYDENHVEISFGDNGSGIKKEDMKKIFEPYYTTKSKGSGLGLMIIERIIREHGAELNIRSKEGEGTIITASFPRHGKRMRVLTAAPGENLLDINTPKDTGNNNE